MFDPLMYYKVKAAKLTNYPQESNSFYVTAQWFRFHPSGLSPSREWRIQLGFSVIYGIRMMNGSNSDPALPRIAGREAEVPRTQEHGGEMLTC
jgi:hypothetical protein